MLNAKDMLTQGIDKLDVFATRFMERGKLNSTTAYELRVGRGLMYRDGTWPDTYKVNIVYFDENENELKRDVGCSTLHEHIARRFIAEQRERYIKAHNKAMEKKRLMEEKIAKLNK